MSAVPPAVVEAHRPLADLLAGRRAATLALRRATAEALGQADVPRPFVVGLTGSVAVGKSTTAAALRDLLAAGADRPRVAVVATDGFLRPNAELEALGIAHRKGYPESYDTGALLAFLDALRRGEPEVGAPLYSHVTYDVVPDAVQVLDRPDVVIVEGIDVLQVVVAGEGDARLVSDRLDVSVYVDADEADVERWFVERIVALARAAADDETSFFHPFATTSDADLRTMGHAVWDAVNGPNLRQHIRPTRERADLVLEKGPDHAVVRIRARA